MTRHLDSVPVALIGYGFAGRTFHAPLISTTPGLHLAVAGSRNADALREAFPETEVLADPLTAATHPEVELVVIASPNDTHARLAEAALRAGKHVIVDKPFTVTLEEARALAELAAEEGRLLSVFQNRRWDGDFLALQDVLASGRLGEVLHFESHFSRYRPEPRARWRERSVPGGGLWYDLGPHLVDQALQLFGLPENVHAWLVCQRPAAEAVDWCHVLLDYGRRKVVLHASMLVAGGVPRFIVHGTQGSWIKHGLDTQEDQLRAGMAPGSDGWGHDPRPTVLFEGRSGVVMQCGSTPGDYREYYARVRDALKRQGPNPVTPMEAVAVMAVIETALHAAEEGRALPLPLTDCERAAWEREDAVAEAVNVAR